jgi:ADP-ribose pyrophosphatase YjhB (NUDIX family)
MTTLTQPVVGVGAVVWRDDRVLLIRRGTPPKQGAWSLPGGKQEWGETVATAAAREVWEETGVRITVGDVVAVVDLIQRDEEDRIQYHYTLVDVLARWESGDAHAATDATDVAWVTLDELGHYELWSETERVIRLADVRRREHQP